MVSRLMDPIAADDPSSVSNVSAWVLTLEHLAKTLDFVEQQISASKAEVARAQRMAEEFIDQKINATTSPPSNPAFDGTNTTLVTLADLVQWLGVTRQTIWHLRKAGNFPEPVRYSRDSRFIRFRKSEIEDWLKSSQSEKL